MNLFQYFKHRYGFILIRYYKEDRYKIILINCRRKFKTNESYVLVNQVQQVYYVKDIKDPNWLVIVK